MKITEAGKLYLKDYYILNEARKEMAEYLNAILEAVEAKLDKMRVEFSNENYKWDYWRNKTTYGEFEFQFTPLIDLPHFRKSKCDLFIKIYDVRITSHLTNTCAIKMRVKVRKTNKELWQSMGQRQCRYAVDNILVDQDIELDMESSDQDAESIIESISEEVYTINQMIDELVESKLVL